jgi:hypothetical protein
VGEVLLVAALVAVPFYLLAYRPFVAVGDLGNVHGGGDGIKFVPWAFGEGGPPSRYVYYTLFSPLHLLDIACAVFVASPALAALLPAGLATGWRNRGSLSVGDLRAGVFLALFGASAASVTVLWNHDFTMWGDWNLATAYLFPAHLAGWGLLAIGGRGRIPRRLAAAALVLQAFGALSIYLQLVP